MLRLIVNGHRMKEIAANLNLSPRTVETIKYEMMRDLNVHSTTELVRYAIEHISWRSDARSTAEATDPHFLLSAP